MVSIHLLPAAPWDDPNDLGTLPVAVRTAFRAGGVPEQELVRSGTMPDSDGVTVPSLSSIWGEIGGHPGAHDTPGV